MRSACLVRTRFILNILVGLDWGVPGPPLATPLLRLIYASFDVQRL